ncbi:MAG: hypothetical protein KGL39_36645 [Patescibacteria group bacterium]|nr:hypothetical protein [Patescibacteria group bacterium]
MLIQGQVGAQNNGDGVTSASIRQGKQGELIASELHGRFYEQAYRGNLFSAGTTAVTALSANTITTSATTTPIVGVYNPVGSGVNVVVLQASLQAFINTLTTPVGAGAFQWAYSLNNPAISTGATPTNRFLGGTASKTKAFNGGVALTGLTNALTVLEGADFTSPTGQTYGTIVAPTTGTTMTGFGGVQNIDGSIVVPPGGVLALLNTTSTTTMSTVARLLWEEVPV